MGETCPTCGETFDNRKGMGVHHGMKHPDRWEDRFWYYVDRGDVDECWEWEAFCTEQGYGRFRLRGENYPAHRLAYRLSAGSASEWVLHHCDNEACCNPAHLYDGDHADNTADMVERGRAASGEDNGDARLTEEEVVEIRERYVSDGGETQQGLADEYGVTRAAVGYILRLETWDRAGPEWYEPPVKAERKKLDRETAAEIKEEASKSGRSQDDVAEEYGVSRSMVGRIQRGDSWSGL